MDALPDPSQNIIVNEYYEYDALEAKMASGLGYEVDLAGRVHRSGDRNEVYFNIEGRKLDPNDYDKMITLITNQHFCVLLSLEHKFQ